MAVQFPDPSVTKIFEGPNGVTYQWDEDDGKWIVKSTSVAGSYVKKQGGDSMEGPLQVTGGRDPDASTAVQSIVKVLSVDSGQNSSLQLKMNGGTRMYVGSTNIAYMGDLKANTSGSYIQSHNGSNLFQLNSNGAFYEGAFTADRHIVTKQKLEEALFTDPSDTTTTKYVAKTGDSMSGTLTFPGLGNGKKAIELSRNAGEHPEVLRLSHPGGSSLGGYDIKLTGNTSYNELRLMGGSNGDTKFFSFKANGRIDFYNQISLNNHHIKDLADGVDPQDPVTVGQLAKESEELSFNINIGASTQKSMRVAMDDLIAPSLESATEDPNFENDLMLEDAYALFPGKDDYHYHHVDQRFILQARMFEGNKTNREDLTDNLYENDNFKSLAILDLKTGKRTTLLANGITDGIGNFRFPSMRGCQIVTNDDGSLNAYLWIHNPMRTVNTNDFSNQSCPLFRIFVPAADDVDDSNPFLNFTYNWTNIRCNKALFTTPTTNPYANYTDASKTFQYEIVPQTFRLKDQFNKTRYIYMSYNKNSRDFCTQRLFEVTFDPNNPNEGVIVPISAHPDSTWGEYAAGYPAIKQTKDGGFKCFLFGSPVGLTELYFVPDGAGVKLEMRNYGDYIPEGDKILDPDEDRVNAIGHRRIIGKGIRENWYKSDMSAIQWLTEGVWDEENPFSTKLVYFQGGYGIVSIPTEDLGNKSDEVRLENNFKGELSAMHLRNNGGAYDGYMEESSVKNMMRFMTHKVDTRSNGSVWFFDYKGDYVADDNRNYNDTRLFDAGGSKTFHYDFKRPILEVRPNIPGGDIDIIAHSIGRKRSDNNLEEGNVTDFSGEGISLMYDQFVCISAAQSHSSISKPRVHIFDPFTKVVSLVSEKEVNSTTGIIVPQRGLIALSDYGGNAAGDSGSKMYYVSMLSGTDVTANQRKTASTLRKLYAVTGDDVATSEDTWTLDPVVANASIDLTQFPDESSWDLE